ncbi:MAG: Ig-like domain-containing protein, partial [Dehalococcoidia bacterium]
DSFEATIEDGNGGTLVLGISVTVTGAPLLVLAQESCVALVVQSASATYTSEFWLEGPDAPRFLGITNHSAAGALAALGTYEAGTELVLSIHVLDTGHVFRTGAGTGNPDGLVHAVLTPGTDGALYRVAFEDLFNGGDLDFNDAVFDLVAIECGVTAGDDEATTDAGESVSVDVLDNDSTEHGTLAVTAVTQGADGSVAIDDGAAVYTPDAGFVGVDAFTYSVENGLGGSATATVTVTVEQASTPPVAVDDIVSTPKNQAVTINVLANDTDADGDALRVVSVTQPGPGNSKGTVTIVGSGAGNQVKFTPKSNQGGTVTFTYTITDDEDGEDTATVTVSIVTPITGKMTGGGQMRTSQEHSNWGIELRCTNFEKSHFNFHDDNVEMHLNKTTFDSLVCLDDPAIDNNRDFDTVVFTGRGKAKVYGFSVEVIIEATLTDGGGNRSNDSATIVVKTASHGYVLTSFSGPLTGGNHNAID